MILLNQNLVEILNSMNYHKKIKIIRRLILSIIILFLFFVAGFLTYENLIYKKEKILGEIKELKKLNFTQKDIQKFSFSIKKINQEIETLNFSIKEIVKILPNTNKKLKYLKLASNFSDISDNILKAIHSTKNEENLIKKIQLLKIGVLKIKPILKDSKNLVDNLDFKEFGNNKIKLEIINLINFLENLDKDLDKLEIILGRDSFKRYFLLFQNTHELRPTGGFSGTFAILEIERGEIKNFYFPPEGTYIFKGLLTHRVQAPMPLWFVGRSWSLHDANFYPDFPSSAQKILWFLEKSEFPSCDGVIAINSDFLEKVLNIIGPIKIPEYNLILNSQNAILQLQNIIESNTARKSGKPKKILTIMLPKLLDKAKDFETQLKLILSMFDALQEKDIQIYFQREDLENWIKEKGFSGEIKNFKNYFNINIANVKGGKNSRVIENSFNLKIYYKNGFLYHTILLKRKHKGSKNQLENIRNISYIRIYIPKNSEIIEFKGENLVDYEKYFKKLKTYLPYDKDALRIETNFKIDKKRGVIIFNSFDKKVISFFMLLNPKQEKQIEISYRYPILKKELKTLSYYFQKQSGLKIKGEINISFPKNYNILKFYKTGEYLKFKVLTNEIKINSEFKTDFWIGVVLN